MPSKESHQITPFSKQDLAVITAIEQRAQINPWSEQLFLDSLKAGHHTWAVRDQDNILAYAVVSTVLDEAELLTICVAPTQQGQGLGHSLLSFILTELNKLAIMACFLEVRRSNHAAISLYKKLGFKQVGERAGYYQGEDALLFKAEINDR